MPNRSGRARQLCVLGGAKPELAAYGMARVAGGLLARHEITLVRAVAVRPRASPPRGRWRPVAACQHGALG